MPDFFKREIVVGEVEYFATVGKVAKLTHVLKQGGDANDADDDGYSALHGAAENGHLDCVRALIAAGADPHPRTRDGLTPLDLAEMEGHEEIAELLDQFPDAMEPTALCG